MQQNSFWKSKVQCYFQFPALYFWYMHMMKLTDTSKYH